MNYAEFVAKLAALSVVGIKKQYGYMPAIDTSGNYPMMFPRLPISNREAITLTPLTGLRNAVCELIIVVERDALSIDQARFNEAMALIDALDDALSAEQQSAGEIDRWAITPEVTEWGWSLRASVEGSW